jgi:hypothetical protein
MMAAGRDCPGAAGGGVGWPHGRPRVRVTPLPARACARGQRREDSTTPFDYAQGGEGTEGNRRVSCFFPPPLRGGIDFGGVHLIRRFHHRLPSVAPPGRSAPNHVATIRHPSHAFPGQDFVTPEDGADRAAPSSSGVPPGATSSAGPEGRRTEAGGASHRKRQECPLHRPAVGAGSTATRIAVSGALPE